VHGDDFGLAARTLEAYLYYVTACVNLQDLTRWVTGLNRLDNGVGGTLGYQPAGNGYEEG